MSLFGFDKEKQDKFDEMQRELHDIFDIVNGVGLEKIGRTDPDNPKVKLLGHYAFSVLKLKNERDDLRPIAEQFQLAKLDAVWTDPAYARLHPTKGKWKCRYNQIDIFMFAVNPDNGDNAVVFERDGKWVGAEQHYPTPFINSQTEHKHVGDAMVAALKAAGWEGSAP